MEQKILDKPLSVEDMKKLWMTDTACHLHS